MIQSHIWVVIAAISVVMTKVADTSANTCITLPSATNLNLKFHTRQVDASGTGLDDSGHKWRLDAVGSWHRPAVGSFSGYGARLWTVPNNYSFEYSCQIDSTCTLTTNESVTFLDVKFGFAYEMRVRTYDVSNSVMQPLSLGSYVGPISSPDCYEETKSAAFCRGLAVQTTGKPVDLRVDRMTRQASGVVEVQVSWVRPVQSNGAIKRYKVGYKQPNELFLEDNGGTQWTPATKEDGEWNRTLRYELTMSLPQSQDGVYELEVTPHVLVGDSDKFGYAAQIVFDIAGVEEPTRIALDSWVPEPNPTPPPRRPLAPNGRELQPFAETVLVTQGATTSPSSDPDTSTTPTTEGDVPPTVGKPASSSILVTASVAVGAAVAFLVTMVFVACLCLRRKKNEDELKKAVFIRTREEEISMYHYKGSLEKNETDYKECLPEFEVKELDRTLLKLEKELGSGQFGVVYKGFAFGVYNREEYSPVAVKSLKCNASLAMKEDFLDEIKLIIEMGTHPNILPVLGCCTVDEPYYLITEFMKYGDLLHFLWKCREENRPDDDPIYMLSETNKIQIARQITRGMEYLSNTRYYHGDLAARNVLVGEDLVVKISDFGLADDIYQNGYKRLAPQRKRPVKWVSLETNMEGKCTIQSDVWSFGIVLYEIYTLGSMPYPGLDGREVIRRLQTGYRMDKPNSCPDDIYDIMRQCWREKPTDRPTFTNLFNTFDKMLVAQCDYMPLEGAVYDHCIPTTGGNGGIRTRARCDTGESNGATATLSLNEEEIVKSDPEQSDTTRLFQKEEIED